MPLPYGIAPPGFRLPDRTRIGRVRLQVADLERSIAYYTQVIGLRVGARSETSAALHAGTDTAPLVELHERRGALPVPRRGAFGLFHFAILLPHRAALGRFVVHLTTHSVRMGSADHLVSEALYLTDPDGLGIEVYSDWPRETWRMNGRELAMTTEPLDLDSLIDEAGDSPWSGAPEGTTIGHVHLHVGDLRVSDAFYHEALGFDRTVWSYPGASFLAAGGYHHHLGTNTWSPGPAARDDQARLLDWELRLPDHDAVLAAVQSLRAAGYAVEEDRGHGVIAADPWGTRVRLEFDDLTI
jgi:catechol 2,3-dioxygenase